MSRYELNKALVATAPIVFAYAPLGLVFGVLFTHADYPWYGAPFMSALVYAGAVQFVALSMMLDDAGIFAILLATLFVALRNSFYGLSVVERFKPAAWILKSFLVFGLVDGTYAILSTYPRQKEDLRFCFYVTLFPYLGWVLGTLVGALCADFITEMKGMDFILTSFFMILVIEYYWVNKKVDALIVPLVASGLAYGLLPHYALFAAILMCACYLFIKIRVWS